MIKKLFYLIIAIGLAVGSSWMPYAAEANTITSITVGGTDYTTSFQTSTGVTISASGGNTANPNSYNAVTYHTKGDKTYGMDSDGGPVYYQSATAVACPTAVTGTADFGSGWTAM